jgi:hypothetical protein
MSEARIGDSVRSDDSLISSRESVRDNEDAAQPRRTSSLLGWLLRGPRSAARSEIRKSAVELYLGTPAIPVVWPADSQDLDIISRFLHDRVPTIVAYNGQKFVYYSGSWVSPIVAIEKHLSGNPLCATDRCRFRAPNYFKEPLSTELMEVLNILGIRYIEWYPHGANHPEKRFVLDRVLRIAVNDFRATGKIPQETTELVYCNFKIMSYYTGELPRAIQRLAPFFGVRYDEVVENGQTIFVCSRKK